MSAVAARTLDPPPPVRVLFVASRNLGYVVPPLAWIRANLRTVDTLVVRRADHGPERAAAAIATSIGATVEHTGDPLAALAGVDHYVIAIRDLDPLPCSVLWAASRAGMVGVCRTEGVPALPDDAPSRASQARAAQLVRELEQRRAQETRGAAHEAARNRRRKPAPASPGRRPGEARQRAWDAHLAREGAAG